MDLALSVLAVRYGADNCQVCAAETDDYRLYCLSQAQSTLIQQSHLYLIYESLSLSSSRSNPLYHFLICFYCSLMSLLAACHCDCSVIVVTAFSSLITAKLSNWETN